MDLQRYGRHDLKTPGNRELFLIGRVKHRVSHGTEAPATNTRWPQAPQEKFCRFTNGLLNLLFFAACYVGYRLRVCLYKKIRSETELAGVLGHEIGHVVKQHLLTIIKKSQAIDMGSTLFSKKLGKMKNEQEGQAVKTLIGSGAEIMARGLEKTLNTRLTEWGGGGDTGRI